MTTKTRPSPTYAYRFCDDGSMRLKRYQSAPPFADFFPGVAGLWGVPMWVFTVNRGQGISSFGIESKDHAICEFQPANKAYRLTASHGFRTFIKWRRSEKRQGYWEPFHAVQQEHQVLTILPHEWRLEDFDPLSGLLVRVVYFTVAGQDFPALVRCVTIENHKPHPVTIDLLDGLPALIPYGVTDWLSKHLSRTVEAWTVVEGLKHNTPFFRLEVEVADRPQVTHIKEGHFYLVRQDKNGTNACEWVPVIIDPEQVFGSMTDFSDPIVWRLGRRFPKKQHFESRTPCAMASLSATITKQEPLHFAAVVGTAWDREHWRSIMRVVQQPDFIRRAREDNHTQVQSIQDRMFTHSRHRLFDAYCGHTFLDNVLRGGLPVSLSTRQGPVVFHVFSRKHGDLERDYNFFVLTPTPFSQGNGNYRDVNQNRRNDVWFHDDVKESVLVRFLNLIQADGFNPLVIKGMTFVVDDEDARASLIERFFSDEAEVWEDLLQRGFQPGQIVQHLKRRHKKPSDLEEILKEILAFAQAVTETDHGEGFWTDHWTYNIDLWESFLTRYPDRHEEWLWHRRDFTFYYDGHYVLDRRQRYHLTDRGVRQYDAVAFEEPLVQGQKVLRDHGGRGQPYRTCMFVKWLALVVNKAASLDPDGLGVEMEAGKPNWYDALNGLPGLLGSSLCETLELLRLTQRLLTVLEDSASIHPKQVLIYEELVDFMDGLKRLYSCSDDPFELWDESQRLKETYRRRIRPGISGVERNVALTEVVAFLKLVRARCERAYREAIGPQGLPFSYFYYEVIQYDIERDDEGRESLIPRAFQRHTLPLFLEGVVHALRTVSSEEARQLHRHVLKSPLYDRRLKMFKVNANLSSMTEEIGRTRNFPRGWLENESIWLHMEYKYLLELIKQGLYDEFHKAAAQTWVCWQPSSRYKRSVLENVSFIVSSAYADEHWHGRGFVARLSGSTAEFVHMWLIMNMGRKPFRLQDGRLVFGLEPVLPSDWFTKKRESRQWHHPLEGWRTDSFEPNTYAFLMMGRTLVEYRNPKRRKTWGAQGVSVKRYHLWMDEADSFHIIEGPHVGEPYASLIREGRCRRMVVDLA